MRFVVALALLNPLCRAASVVRKEVPLGDVHLDNQWHHRGGDGNNTIYDTQDIYDENQVLSCSVSPVCLRNVLFTQFICWVKVCARCDRANTSGRLVRARGGLLWPFCHTNTSTKPREEEEEEAAV